MASRATYGKRKEKSCLEKKEALSNFVHSVHSVCLADPVDRSQPMNSTSFALPCLDFFHFRFPCFTLTCLGSVRRVYELRVAVNSTPTNVRVYAHVPIIDSLETSQEKLLFRIMNVTWKSSGSLTNLLDERERTCSSSLVTSVVGSVASPLSHLHLPGTSSLLGRASMMPLMTCLSRGASCRSPRREEKERTLGNRQQKTNIAEGASK